MQKYKSTCLEETIEHWGQIYIHCYTCKHLLVHVLYNQKCVITKGKKKHDIKV